MASTSTVRSKRLKHTA